ncbi:MAG: STAS domain-containing protein [Calditrichaeota bacterium]|nr:STAS domain-containing protein [Calditrichota bacterium]HQU74503.1 STAS domain-containing protein [Calditrichia bacterium]
MEFTHHQEEQVLHISLSGNIIFEDTHEVGNFLDGLLEEEFEEAVINLTGVTGITSSAIGAILDFYSQLINSGRKMRIKGMSDKAYKVFQYFKLDTVFPVER